MDDTVIILPPNDTSVFPVPANNPADIATAGWHNEHDTQTGFNLPPAAMGQAKQASLHSNKCAKPVFHPIYFAADHAPEASHTVPPGAGHALMASAI